MSPDNYLEKTHLTLGTSLKTGWNLGSLDLEETPNSPDSVLELKPG